MLKKIASFSLVFLFMLLAYSFCQDAQAYGHTVIVRVVRVTTDWIPYASTDGWTQAVSIKESDKLKYFEVAIWEETSSVHLYEFPNNYDPSYGNGRTDAEKIAYREQFALKVFDGMPFAENPGASSITARDKRSTFLKEAFIPFIDIISNSYRLSNHALMFSGHGSPGGALFDNLLAPKHSQDLLLYWANKIGKKLAFIDMGGPCNKGGYSDLNSFCPYSEFYIASDLPNGGYTFDDFTYEKYQETNPEFRYHDLIANQTSLTEVLAKRIEIIRKRYEYSQNNMVQNKVEQANYLYSCESFKGFYDKTSSTIFPPFTDLYSHINGNADLINSFNAVFVKTANNRDFFEWEVTANGMLTPNRLDSWFSEMLLKIEYPSKVIWPQTLCGGWCETWMDWVNDVYFPWGYQDKYGWIYIFGTDPNNLWLYNLRNNDYWWTTADLWPYIYFYNEAGWFYNEPGTNWFVNLNTGQWVQK